MTPELAQHIKKEISLNGLTNAFFNGVIAWWLLKDVPALDWWGKHSFGVDILATAFLLPFIVALIVIPLSRKKRASNKIPALLPNYNLWLERLVARFPRSLFWSATLFGAVGILLMATVTLLAFKLFGIEQVDPLHYSIFKAFWAGLMAFLLAGPMIMVGVRTNEQ
ncbi:MAG: hypothetical protein GYB33_12075 [Gammaproteobacteria bacterium]|uniref:hypothetical protein n=1 Tax=Pseudomaricurvus alcaniphilus TaxID=1166482 RepID=UPI00140A42F1|nr:hypothetical protein [Pseudomaricurvus alcaniphilus]MBR9911075.1 hypothetical protein [Gammaproteobacteria bacterium]NHN36421.1 hypothetical protein [Pseudomaricurvus alcaniphilus]